VRRRGLGEADVEEAESYFSSMTDMMVGVLFIFIILLSFFALQFHTTTAKLTQAKDAQTSALLKLATALQPQEVTAEVDRAHHIVCLPGAALTGAGGDGKHCFAFSDQVLSAAERASAAAEKAKAAFMSFLQADLDQSAPPVKGAVGTGELTFPADSLFQPDSATLTPAGVATAKRVADILATRLPCYGYGVPTTTDCGGAPKMAVVNVQGQSGFDASTEAGRAAVALSLQRSVAFHQALLQDDPLLAQVRTGPQAGAEPLLRVSTFGQSQSAPASGAQRLISIQFGMAG
jgi:hypothetical protein